MRVIKEITYTSCKASIFYMNQKYIVKFETGTLEQSYKISEIDYVITDVSDIEKIIDNDLLIEVEKIFDLMKVAFVKSTRNYA